MERAERAKTETVGSKRDEEYEENHTLLSFASNMVAVKSKLGLPIIIISAHQPFITQFELIIRCRDRQPGRHIPGHHSLGPGDEDITVTKTSGSSL
jgi:hypothetical protein